MKKQTSTILFAFLFSILIPTFGYFYTGWLIALLFLIGYLTGFFLWLFIPIKVPFDTFKAPYWLTLLIFILLHKVEENRMKFFEIVGEKITGIAVPAITPFLVICLLILPIGSWLLIPILAKRGNDIGYYLAWTFFTSTGIIELAHFIFPLLTNEPYGYFPGMITALPLAAAGWWGMWRLSKKNSKGEVSAQQNPKKMKFYTTMPKKLDYFYQEELTNAAYSFSQGDLQHSWQHLERAHIIGQPYPFAHSFVHWKMLIFGIKTKNTKEIIGQIPRLLFGGIKSFIGHIPIGNTGGANVPPFKSMEIEKEILNIIKTNSNYETTHQ